jgi:hypothetical protein
MLAQLRRMFRRPPVVDIERWKTAPRVYGDVDDTHLNGLARKYPARAAATIEAAERICRHEFALLGSGAFVPADPERTAERAYQPIDWYIDPVRRLRFPRGIPHTKWDLYAMRPGLADIKYPWELARCQHWVALGQAFRLTHDEPFAREVAAELRDFMQANPVGIGVNWTCTMDVALRATSWILGLELVRASTALDDAFWNAALTALFEHGVFIRGNLENTYEVTSNHFLSNLVGLWFLGAVFATTDEGREWTAFARDALEREMTVQVLPDGADYESSIPYHRFVTELFLSCARLGDASGEPFSASYRARLRDMVSYLAAVLRPDGLLPQVGDADDGRAHVFSDYGRGSPQDARHLLAAAGAVFGDDGWMAMAGEVAEWESTWWGVPASSSSGPATATPTARAMAIAPEARLFRDAGVAVVRSANTYLLITNGIVGTNGFGNHKHNDQLSFELHTDGHPLVVDAGSYVYTSDPDARNLFRSTRYHNTLQVDALEQNDFKHEWLFRMFESARPEHAAFDARGDWVEYVGRHHGFERLADPIVHERAFHLNRSTVVLRISDRLRGRGEHAISWHVHLAPGVTARAGDGHIVLERTGVRPWRLSLPDRVSVGIGPAWYSPSYGVRVDCSAIDVTTRVTIAGECEWTFTFELA